MGVVEGAAGVVAGVDGEKDEEEGGPGVTREVEAGGISRRRGKASASSSWGTGTWCVWVGGERGEWVSAPRPCIQPSGLFNRTPTDRLALSPLLLDD